jgi:hypothetical protein
MRLYEVEFSKEELTQLREELRRENPDLTEEQLDEILPAIALGAARLAPMALRGAGALAKGVGKVGSMAARGIGTAAKAAGKAIATGARATGRGINNFAAKQATKQLAKKTSNNLSLGGRTDQSGAGSQQDPAAEINAMAQANSELQATYQAKVKEIEKALGDMKKSLKLS